MIRNPDSLNGIDEAYQTILARLRSILVQWRLLTFSQNFLCWLSVIIISFSIALLIDQVVPLPRLVRMGLVVIVVGICIGFGYLHLVRSLFLKLGYRRVSAYIEASHPEIQNCISSAVQLRSEIERNRFGYSIVFIEKIVSFDENIGLYPQLTKKINSIINKFLYFIIFLLLNLSVYL